MITTEATRAASPLSAPPIIRVVSIGTPCMLDSATKVLAVAGTGIDGSPVTTYLHVSTELLATLAARLAS